MANVASLLDPSVLGRRVVPFGGIVAFGILPAISFAVMKNDEVIFWLKDKWYIHFGPTKASKAQTPDASRWRKLY